MQEISIALFTASFFFFFIVSLQFGVYVQEVFIVFVLIYSVFSSFPLRNFFLTVVDIDLVRSKYDGSIQPDRTKEQSWNRFLLPVISYENLS